MNTKYDMVLLERPLDKGLSLEEVARILSFVDDSNFIPVEIQGENSSAMGFIGTKKADQIEYEYLEGSNLFNFVQEIMEDVEKERPDCTYRFKSSKKVSLKILLTRDFN